MEQIFVFLNQAADYINWVIQFHLVQYFYLAVIVVVMALILLIFTRSKLMYLFPIIFGLVATSLLIMVFAGKAQFDWDYMLLLAFVNFAVGYVLFVIISMAINRRPL